MNRTKHPGGEIVMIKQKLKQEREPDMFKNQWMTDHPGRSDEDFERWKRWAEEDLDDDDDCIDYFIEECEEVWDGGICTIAARQANISLAQAQAILAESGYTAYSHTGIAEAVEIVIAASGHQQE
jgi:hypothetical protein